MIRLNAYLNRALLLLGLAAFAGGAQGQARFTQTFELQPGWNAVYLEVLPDQPDMEAALAGTPVASVWRFIPDRPGLDYIQDPSEGLMNVEGWFGYFPEPRPEAFLSNLFTLTSNVAYLIDLDSDTPVTWSVTGKPVIRSRSWAADAFTLTGFEVDPANPLTFGEYFEASSAHQNQPIFALSSQGNWEEVTDPANTFIDSGRAYWVFSEGPSAFQGPFQVSVDQDGELEYSSAVSQQTIAIENENAVATDITVRTVSTGTMPLAFEQIDPDTSEVAWPALPPSLDLPIQAGGDLLLNLGVRRNQFTDTRMEEILEISNGMGIRRLLFVGANTLQPVIPAAALKQAGLQQKGGGVNEFAGLWVGSARVNQVSESQLAGTTPLPAGSNFPIRLIVHIDSLGTVRLLKEVIVLFEEGTMEPSTVNPAFMTDATPGRYVLVTDDNLIANFTGAKTRAGIPVGIRYSTVSFDFMEQFIELPGSFDPDGSYSGQIVINSDDPINPFKHKFHPDHDNLDAQFLNPLTEAPQITRDFSLNFSSDDPTNQNLPEYGSSIVSGVFSEAISGLHRNTIFVEGPFRLEKVSNVSVLNQ